MPSALLAPDTRGSSFHIVLAVLLAWLWTTPVQAVEISGAWARASVPGAQVGAAYLTLRSPVKARLVAVSSPACARVEMHASGMEDGVMRMRQLEAVELPAGQTVEFKPMGAHLMLMGLKAPLKAGERIILDLVVQTGGKRRKLTTVADIKPLTE